MLTRIDLRTFKCFESLSLPLAPLTLLSGANAAGKSSVLQALVLLHQTIREHEWSTRLMLNGRTIQLGTVLDVLDVVHGRHSFGLGLLDGDRSIQWSFVGERDEMSMAVERVILAGHDVPAPATLRYLIPPGVDALSGGLVERLLSLSYITAERIGPREVYALEDRQAARVVGPRGEHTVSVLYRGRDEPVRTPLAIKGVAPTRLRQIEAHMQRLFPGCSLDVQLVPQANAVTLGLRTSNDTRFHRPVHVGFGLTQVLPIIVAALSAATDDILLIENPEVHLHPAGQAQIGALLAEVAASGVQVVIETHSDHVLNGIRRSVRAGSIPASDVALHFFRPRGEGVEQVVSPMLDPTGNIDFWPEGFFDQFDKDMNHFAGFGA